MNIEKALLIPGWMTEQELNWLAEQAKTHRVIAEIGSWRGRSTRALADNTPGVVFATDTWDDKAKGVPGWWTAQEDSGKYKRKDWLFQEFRANLADHLNLNVFQQRSKSTEGAKHFARNGFKFDMIFIDAGHNLKEVKEDIRAWSPLLKEGGLFCGHDYNEKMWPEVAPAVNDLVKLTGVVDTIWYGEKKA